MKVYLKDGTTVLTSLDMPESDWDVLIESVKEVLGNEVGYVSLETSSGGMHVIPKESILYVTIDKENNNDRPEPRDPGRGIPLRVRGYGRGGD
jgi:hypothetical protein